MVTDLKFEYPINKVFAVSEVLKPIITKKPADEAVNLTFVSSSTSVCSVNSTTGVLTGVAVGRSKITVTDSISGLSDVCNISVVANEDKYDIILDEINENMIKGYSFAMNDHYNESKDGPNAS